MLLLIATLSTAAIQSEAICHLGAAWGTQPSSADIRNILSMTGGQLSWNNVSISDEVLRQYLRLAASIVPVPEAVIDTTGMDCADTKRIAAEIEAAGACTPDICRAYDVVRPPPSPAPPAPTGRY